VNAPEELALPSLTRFEANLVRILRYFLRRFPADRASSLLHQSIARPACLRRVAVQLVQDTLAKGVPLLLARGGGWRRERHLRGGQRVEGRLWERTPPQELGLTFSRQALELLLWFTAENPTDKKAQWWHPRLEQLTEGDELLFLFALGGLFPPVAAPVLTNLGFANLGLCRLGYPEHFAALTEEAPFTLGRWTTGLGACLLEALQTRLAGHWLELEQTKVRQANWQAMQALGREQGRVLQALLDAVEKAGRLDLARFLLRVLAELLPEGAKAQHWLGGLKNAGPRLADRTETHRAALVMLHTLERLRHWSLQARTVSYFDETYAASQLWKADWELFQGDALWTRAQRILREVEPL
jgi:hypothetical protein